MRRLQCVAGPGSLARPVHRSLYAKWRPKQHRWSIFPSHGFRPRLVLPLSPSGPSPSCLASTKIWERRQARPLQRNARSLPGSAGRIPAPETVDKEIMTIEHRKLQDAAATNTPSPTTCLPSFLHRATIIIVVFANWRAFLETPIPTQVYMI